MDVNGVFEGAYKGWKLIADVVLSYPKFQHSNHFVSMF